MIEKIQHATASSPEGAKGLVKGVLACAFQNMAFMLPTGLLYLLVKDLLAGSTSGRSTFYLLGCVALPIRFLPCSSTGSDGDSTGASIISSASSHPRSWDGRNR